MSKSIFLLAVTVALTSAAVVICWGLVGSPVDSDRPGELGDVGAVLESDGVLSGGAVDDAGVEREPASERLPLHGVGLEATRVAERPALAPIVLRGTVRRRGDSVPVEGAIVRIEPVHALRQNEGPSVVAGSVVLGESDIVLQTDAYGCYTTDKLPRTDTPLKFSVSARGHGLVVHEHVSPRRDEAVHVEDFDLSRGYEIDGSVVDVVGRPIADAEVKAIPMQSIERPGVGHDFDMRPRRATTDAQGRFVLLGLAQSGHVLRVTAPGYIDEQIHAAGVGVNGLRITLARQGTIRVTVSAPGGEAVPEFRYQLFRFTEGVDHLGNLGLPPVEVRAEVGGDVSSYHVQAVSPGSYMLEVSAEGYAKTRSGAFEVGIEQVASTPVDVMMNLGGRLMGRVVDPSGRPIVGVSIGTFSDDGRSRRGWKPGRPVPGLLGDDRTTHATRQTMASGQFEFGHLAPGRYQLQFYHRDHLSVERRDIEVREGASSDLGIVTLKCGAQLSGTVMHGGQPAARAQVILVAVRRTVDQELDLRVVTDQSGRFTIPRGLPEGEYLIHAESAIDNDPEGPRRRARHDLGQRISLSAGDSKAVVLRLPQS